MSALAAALVLAACGGGNGVEEDGKTAASATDAASGDARQRAQATPTRLPIRIEAVADPLLTGLTIPANAVRRGMWSAAQAWSMNATHLALLPDGKVLSYGTAPGRPDVRDGRSFDFWDPAGGWSAAAHRVIASPNSANTFGSSAAFQKDGNLLIVGGESARDTTLVRWRTGEVVGGGFKLLDERWYATAITLANGRVAAIGGLQPGKQDQVVANVAGGVTQDQVVAKFAGAVMEGTVSFNDEVLLPGEGWTSPNLLVPPQQLSIYPMGSFLPDGTFTYFTDTTFVPGIGIAPHVFSAAGGYRSIAAFAARDLRVFPKSPFMGAMSAAAMYAPNKFLLAGGPGELADAPEQAVRKVAMVDMSASPPLKEAPTNMVFARRMANATVLPTGDVAVTGGTGFQRSPGAEAVLDAEIWSPKTERWTTVAKAPVARVHHSAALLLPNGTLLSTGNVPEPGAQENAELYYPPYLFRATATGASELAPRPVITGVNTLSAAHGAPLQLELGSGQKAARVVLLRSGTVSQGFNNGQRLVELPFLQTGDVVEATLPLTGDIAPPGYYLVHILDAAGVPSRAVTIGIGLEGAATAAAPVITGGVVALRSVAQPELLMKARSTGEPVVSPVGAAIPGAAQVNLVAVETVGASTCFNLTVPGGTLGLELATNPGDTALNWREVAANFGRRLCAQTALGGRGVTISADGRYLRVVDGRMVWATDTTNPFPFFSTQTAFELVQVAPAPAVNQAPVDVRINSAVYEAGRALTVFSTSAYDTDGLVVKVEVFAEGSDVALPTRENFFPFPIFVASGNPAGVRFRARATDNLGAVSWSPFFKVGNTPPRVGLSGVSNGAILVPGTPLTLSTNPGDADGWITRVDFYDGASLIGSRTSRPWTMSWVPTAGTHVLTVQATDNDGAVSAPFAVTVSAKTGGNTPPKARITAPATGTTVAAGTAVTLTSNPGDTDGWITRLEFYDGATLIGTRTASPGPSTGPGLRARTR